MSNTPEYRARRAAQARARRQNPEVRERDLATWRRYYLRNKERLSKYQREYRANPENKARIQNHQRKRYFTPDYRLRQQERVNAANRAERAFLAGRPQPDVCDVCGRPENHKDGVVFDHCHQKGHFRGWLCRNCNWTLGLVEDDPFILLKLIAYLKRTSNGSSPQLPLPGI